MISESPFHIAYFLFSVGRAFAMAMLVLFSIVAIATGIIIVKVFERRQDVLYGRYISRQERRE
jgi:hypothetical protein